MAALGRNPLIGVILGWASSSGGFTANLFLAGTDALLAGITEGVVKEMGVAVDINPAMNYFFMASATFFLSVTLTFYGKLSAVWSVMGMERSIWLCLRSIN